MKRRKKCSICSTTKITKDICGENTKMTKIEKAQESCEQVLNGIEDGTITTTSALLVILYARPFSREEKVTWKY